MTDYLTHEINHNDLETLSVFDELSFWSSRFGDLLFRHIELLPNIHILDLACGMGFPLFELAHVHGRSSRVTGLDTWAEALERARLKLKVYRLPNAALVQGDGAHMPFRDSAFDLIVSNLGVNNFEDPQAVFSECFRVARPQARVVLTTNIVGHMQEFYAVFREVLVATGKGHYLEKLKAQEEHRGTRASICALLEDAGFTIERVIEESFRMRYLDGSAFLNHWLIKFGFLGGWRSVITPDDEDEVFRLIEDKLNQIAAREGELGMTIPMLYVEGRKPASTSH